MEWVVKHSFYFFHTRTEENHCMTIDPRKILTFLVERVRLHSVYLFHTKREEFCCMTIDPRKILTFLVERVRLHSVYLFHTKTEEFCINPSLSSISSLLEWKRYWYLFIYFSIPDCRKNLYDSLHFRYRHEGWELNLIRYLLTWGFDLLSTYILSRWILTWV